MTQQEDDSTQVGRKRALSEPDRDIMEEIAPTAAAIKRRRLERGEDPVPRREPTPPPAPPPPEEDMAESPPPSRKSGAKGKGKAAAAAPKRARKGGPTDPDDILDLAIRHREEEDTAAQAERDRLTRELQDGDVDYEAIRRLTIVEPMEVHREPAPNRRSREQDIEEGRWNPRWNGRKNFKKFRKQGEPAGRPQQRVIMSLEPVRMKEYGIGDDYWLESGANNTQSRTGGKSQSGAQSQTAPTQAQGRSQAARKEKEREVYAIGSSDESENGPGEDGNEGKADSLPDVMDIEAAPSRSRKGKAAEQASSKQSQAARSQATRGGSKQTSGSKRAAAAPSEKEKPAKKRATRSTRQASASDDEDSDDGLNFKFGKRR